MTAILTDRTAKFLLARERLESYAAGEWVRGEGKGAELFHAVTGEKIGEASSEGLDFKAMVEYARSVGGPALRKMTFHERARMLKAMAAFLTDERRKAAFYAISAATSASRSRASPSTSTPSTSPSGGCWRSSLPHSSPECRRS